MKFAHSHFRSKPLCTLILTVLNKNKWWEWWECSWQWTNINLECLLFSYYSKKKKNPNISCSRQYICINVFLCILLNRETYAEGKTTGYWVCRNPDFKTETCKEKSALGQRCPLIQTEISTGLFLSWLKTCFNLPAYNSFHKHYIFLLFSFLTPWFLFNIHTKNIHCSVITGLFIFLLIFLPIWTTVYCRLEVWINFS